MPYPGGVNLVRLLPVILSVLLLAAHLSRNNLDLAALLTPAILLLLLVRRPWVPRIFQVLLVLAAAEWLRTLIVLALRRQAAGAPWVRLVAILAVVAAVSALSALVFRSAALRRRYRLP